MGKYKKSILKTFSQRNMYRVIPLLHFIEEFREENQYSPTIREMISGSDLTSTSMVEWYLNSLQEEGLIKRTPFISRSIHLTPKGVEFLNDWREYHATKEK